MTTRLTDINVTISNFGSGSGYWEMSIGALTFRLVRGQDYQWALERGKGSGYFEHLLYFTCRDSLKALQRGIKEAFIAGGVLA